MDKTTHLQREIVKLKSHILELGAEVERSLESTHEALVRLDVAAAEGIRQHDRTIDSHEVYIEEECLKILALYQPVSSDLRMVVAILKINTDLERMADLAANVAGYIPEIAKGGRLEISDKFRLIFAETRAMVRQSLDALVTGNSELAREVLRHDDIVDRLNVEIIQEIVETMKANPPLMVPLMFLVSVSRSIERTADNATNIAEDVYYMVTGEIIRHNRGKR